jgi:4-hydroxy-tetrahydrodipicolinate synthase
MTIATGNAKMDFSGAYTAIVTPFDENGEIDEDGLKKNIHFQIKEGIDGIIPVGTTDESPTVTEKEHERIIDISVEAAKGKIKVIAGTGSNSTAEAIHYTKYAKDAGADAALLVSPYYNKPTPEGMYQHFKKIAETVNIPQVLYNVPGRTGKNLDAETTLRLSKVKNIVGIKEASCDLEQIMKILRDAPKDFVVISGEDSWTFAMMCLGAKGVISVASNVAPRAVADMVHKYLAGDLEGSRQLHYKYLDLYKVIFCETSPGPIKAAMEMMKMPAGKPRLPLVEPAEASKEKIRKVLQQLKLV